MRATMKRRPVASPRGRARAGAEAAQVVVPPGTRAEQYAAGKALRTSCPREAHAAWKAPSDRRGRGRTGPGGGEGTHAGPAPAAPRTHGPLGVHVLPGRGPHDGDRPGVRRRPPGSASSAAAMRTCATSADSPPRSGRSSSRSTTSTRRCRRRGSGTSSAWPRASWWRAGTTA